DLGYEGQAHTWWNGSIHPFSMKERIYRVWVSITWMSQFSKSKVVNTPSTDSDHYQLLLKITSGGDEE
ncbi:unnamed protein product, partial [Ilex paraguariensis]